MSKAEFLDRLAKIKGLEWHLEHGAIRARHNGVSADEHCPITAVVEEITGYFYSIGDFGQAAESIRLGRHLAEVIADAADNNCIAEVSGSRAVAKRRAVRAQLLHVLGLAEPA